MARRVEWGEIAMAEWPLLLPWVTAVRKKGAGIRATARGGHGCMGYARSGGGGRSAYNTNMRWQVVTEPPRRLYAHVSALWSGHAARAVVGRWQAGPTTQTLL
jgi:hypothetical protein